jgi:hypothetical protein
MWPRLTRPRLTSDCLAVSHPHRGLPSTAGRLCPYATPSHVAPGDHPFPFLAWQDRIKNGTYPQEQPKSGKISKSYIKCGFYLDSSWFSVRGRFVAPLQSLKPYKRTSLTPSWTLFPTSTFKTRRVSSPHRLVAPLNGLGASPESPEAFKPMPWLKEQHRCW